MHNWKIAIRRIALHVTQSSGLYFSVSGLQFPVSELYSFGSILSNDFFAA